MKQTIWIAAALMLATTLGYGQSSAVAPAQERKVFFGGNLGLNFSSHYWFVHVAPLVGYRFTPAVSGGVGVIYQYESYSRIPSYEVQSFGGLVFARYDLSANLMKSLPFGLFVQADYEKMRDRIQFHDNMSLNRTVYSDHLFMGLGYIQPAGRRARVFLLVSFDVLNLDKHHTPLLRAGVTF